MIQKEARKPSSDPKQEALRQNKANWNKSVSKLISNLIEFKKLMNGQPNKMHMQKSKISEEIPADPSSILDSLASEFQYIAQKGNAIVQQQLDYSKTRRQKQPKQPGTPAAPSLAQQLTAANDQYDLIAEASNPLSRFYSRLKGPWFGDTPEARTKKYRNALLRTATELDKDFSRLQAFIVGSDPESIFSSGKILQKIENHLYYMIDTIKAHQTTLTFEEPAKTIYDPVVVQAAVDDFRIQFHNFTDLDSNLSKQLSAMILGYTAATDEEKLKLAPELMQTYQAILSDVNKKRHTNGNSLEQVLMTTKSASHQIQIVAQSLLTKWLGKVKHKLTPFDKTSAIRLDIYNVATEAKKALNSIMNSLEGGFVPEEINPLIGMLNKMVSSMKELMLPLESIIRGKMFDKPFMDLLEQQKITDYDFGLDDKQKQQLQKMIQTKQLRQLTNMYSDKKK